MEAEKLAEAQRKKEEAGQEITEEEKKKLADVQKAANQDINMDKITKKLENTNEKLNQIKTRKIKKLRIIDIKLIPREYLLPNEAKIKEDLLNNIAIPGAEMYEEEIAVNSY